MGVEAGVACEVGVGIPGTLAHTHNKRQHPPTLNADADADAGTGTDTDTDTDTSQDMRGREPAGRSPARTRRQAPKGRGGRITWWGRAGG